MDRHEGSDETPQPPLASHACDGCGSRMFEALRLRQHDTVFIWYECPGQRCNAQHLVKLPVEEIQPAGAGQPVSTAAVAS